MAMKKLNCAARYTAGDAWQAGKLVKHADGPRQTKCKPSNRHAERGKRSAQPHQLMIDFTWSKTPNANLHFRESMLRCAPGTQRAEHDCNQEYASAANDQRNEHGNRGTPRIGFVRTREPDAVEDDFPNPADQSAAERDHKKRAG